MSGAFDAAVAFLLDRLADEELAARAAQAGPWKAADGALMVVSPVDGGWDQVGEVSRVADDYAADAASVTHIALHDPAKVLRRVEQSREAVRGCLFWRRILTKTRRRVPTSPSIRILEGRVSAYTSALWLMVRSYDWHPLFRSEWSPAGADL